MPGTAAEACSYASMKVNWQSMSSARPRLPVWPPDMFGDALPQAEKYAALLTGSGVERGVVGPAEADRIWDRHC